MSEKRAEKIPPGGAMKFGIFDHVDDSGAPLREHFENRLKLIEAYDRGGFHAYHIAEHHGTPLGYAPSPSVFLAAAAQRTKRIRLGPLIYVLPLYHPLRLAEEICMLDHLCDGRLMLGVGRGASPIEAGYFGVPAAEIQARYFETTDILLKALQSERLTYQGKFHSFVDAPMTMRPLQQPHPELWYATRSPESFAWAAKAGAHTVTIAFDDQVKAMTDIYRRAWAEAGRDPKDLPLVGVSRHIVVAETDARAKALAARAYAKWVGNLRRLWLDKGMPPPMQDLYPDTWEELEARANGCAGSPETVRRYVLQEAERCGANYLVSWFAFGDLPFADALRSAELFRDHVMPAFV
jgi:alkanesulfonate monooxygenase SsuD/methylene tetrahydromethanopterin reductase-like flavin-dependent oxidoreductase (luciferase family)